VWAYEGRFTLSHFVRTPDYPFSLAAPLLGDAAALDEYEEPELVVAQLVTSQLLASLRAVHAVGLVHRDVKPLNLVLDERERRFKLIDLGACADLRTGKNFVPDEVRLSGREAAPSLGALTHVASHRRPFWTPSTRRPRSS
jgi:serine/threonine protein kinase